MAKQYGARRAQPQDLSRGDFLRKTSAAAAALTAAAASLNSLSTNVEAKKPAGGGGAKKLPKKNPDPTHIVSDGNGGYNISPTGDLLRGNNFPSP